MVGLGSDGDVGQGLWVEVEETQLLDSVDVGDGINLEASGRANERERQEKGGPCRYVFLLGRFSWWHSL